MGILLLSRSTSHVSFISSCRISKLKAPVYERKALATRQSPTSHTRDEFSCSMSAVHRSRSEPSPAMSLEAALSRRSMVSAFSLSSFSSAEPASNFSLSSLSMTLSEATSSLILTRSLAAWRRVFSALATACRFGLTVLATP